MKSNLKTILAMVMFTIALPIGAQMFSNLDMNCVVPYSNDETIDSRNLVLIKMNWEKMSLLNGSLIEIENLRKNLKDIIRNQEQQMAACPYSKLELDLVENNLYQVTEILAGRAILASDK